MIKKIILLFLATTSLISCKKEIHSLLLERGDWSISSLYVKQDFSGKISEYYVSNAGTFHFEKEEKGRFTNASDSTFSNTEFKWISDGARVSLTFDSTSVSEKWTILKSEISRQEWEITQNIIHQKGGLSFTEKRYRKIILEK
jgi:hypothetical protein